MRNFTPRPHSLSHSRPHTWGGRLAPTLATALGALMLSAVASAQPAAQPPELRTGTWGFDVRGQDPSVRPGDDFFEFANGGFLNSLDIPADRSTYGLDPILAERAQLQLRDLLSASDRPAGAGASDTIKARALYAAFMDQGRIDQLGAKPLAGDLQMIRSAKSRAALAVIGARPESMETELFRAGITQDAKNPDRYAVLIGQEGLGLPDRDFYLKPAFAAKKAKYQNYVARMLELAGWPDPVGAAREVVAFETRVAEASWARVERRDPNKTYNPMSVGELEAFAPGYPWRGVLDAAELKGVRRVIVAERSAFPKLATIWTETPLVVLKAWSAFHLTDNAAPYLSDTFEAARFAFRGTVLGGQPQDKPRWKRAVALTDDAMGEAAGRLYVGRYFPPEAKARIGALVDNLKVAMRGRIERLDWMSAQTKARAVKKLDTMVVKLGYPDRWRSYAGLRVSRTDLYGDVVRAKAFDWRREVRRLNKPVDRTEWGMTPQTVNAYYNSTSNEIVFPAAQMQSPYFGVSFDPAANYGGIGGVIGHEMTHAFDDRGRKFDASGKLEDWWTAEDAKRFEARADALGKQYDAYEPFPGAHVNGKLTMGENIADLGGLLVALDAYHTALKGKPAPVIDGLTGDQRSFLAYGQSWRAKVREDEARQRVVTDPHSPARYRVDGVVRNIDAWYDAWGVKPSDKLYLAPEARARIW